MAKSTEPKPFTLSGKVAGLTKDGRKVKGIKVKAGDKKYRIKLAKPLRQALPSNLSKGKPVQLSGMAKRKKGELRLKAEVIEVLEVPAPPMLDISEESPPSLEKAIANATTADTTATAPAPQSNPESAPESESKRASKSKQQSKPVKVLICQKGSCWKKRKGREICERLEQRLGDRGLRDAVTIKKTGCMDRCKTGPNVVIMPGKVRLSHVGRADIDKLIDQHVAAPS